MKKILVSLSLLLVSGAAISDPVATPPAPAAPIQWTKYYEQPQYELERFYSKSSVRPDGKGNLKVNILNNMKLSCLGHLKEPDPVTKMMSFCYRSTIWEAKVDCKNKTWTINKRKYYNEQMASGKLMSTEEEDQGWAAITEDSPDTVALASKICK